MKWMRPQANFVYPNPQLGVATHGGLGAPLFSDNGRLVCVEWLPGSDDWSIVDNPLPHFLVDGEDFSPVENSYYGGAMCWQGPSGYLHYSPGHRAWILQTGDPYSSGIPTAYRDWATREWKGGSWYESYSLSYSPSETTTFAPKGTLLNDSGAASKTARIYLPRWERERDGYSGGPCGRYVGKDGKEGVKYIGAAAYEETGTRNVWTRKGEGTSAYLRCARSGETSTTRRNFSGPGRGWGVIRGDILYFASALPAGVEGATLAPWTWDEETRKYVAATGADPLELVYKGRVYDDDSVDAYFTEVALWR